MTDKKYQLIENQIFMTKQQLPNLSNKFCSLDFEHMRKRLVYAQAEKDYFNINLPARLEILFKIACHGGNVPLQEMLNFSSYSQASLRLHLNQLSSEKMVRSFASSSDYRSREITFTEVGLQIFNDYLASVR